MFRNRIGRSGLVRPIGLVAAVAAVAAVATLAGCSGSSSGSSSFQLVGAIAEGLGLLPQNSVYLNNKIVVDFSDNVDPASVTPQTFRLLIGPDFIDPAEGTVGVSGRRIVFIPKLPTENDLSDSGFQADTTYRLICRGSPDLNVIRSKTGKPLTATSTFEFRTRENEPFFSDFAPGPPTVLGVMVDVDGDGMFDGDGDPATPGSEEFFAADIDFDTQIPFIRDVSVGSANRPAPNAPLQVAVILSEPVQPGTVFVDEEDLDGDGVPDGNGEIDTFFLRDQTNPYACDEPNPGDMCPRPVRFSFELTQEYIPDRDAFLVLATMEARYALLAFAEHEIFARQGLLDFVGNELEDDFSAVFETGERLPADDSFFEDFSDREDRDAESTALWNVLGSGYLQAGPGIGGDGGDGEALDPDSATAIFDTTGNSGIWNFSSMTFPSVPEFNFIVRGDKPAIIRVFGDIDIPSGVVIEGSGAAGAAGGEDSAAPRPGGKGGPGGGDGGTASGSGPGTTKGDDGVGPLGPEGGGGGGLSGSAPGGGGGGAHRSAGIDGQDGSGASGSGGDGGEAYGDPTLDPFVGGAGGGGGGNNNNVPAGSPGNAGGGGGGGGGAVLIECFGEFRLGGLARIFVNGGDGGGGARISNSDADSAGGGAGAGGSILIRCLDVVSLGGRIQALGGTGGSTQPPAGRGGAGADGYIRFEDLDARPPCSLCEPNDYSYSQIDPDLLGFTIGRSRFFNTNLPAGGSVTYAFDGNFADGTINPFGSDITLLDENGDPTTELPPNATVEVWFRGAQEDPANPNNPDAATITPWVAVVGQLNGLPMIQYEVRMDIGDNVQDFPPAPGVDDLRIRFRTE
jgi:hypothetical protein